jgi:acid phosphatase type 7
VARLPIVLAACIALGALGVAASRGSDGGQRGQADTASQLPVVGPRVAAAGDIACDPASSSFDDGVGTGLRCRQLATSDLLVGRGYAAVLALGDLQYEEGAFAAFLASYARSWGRVKAITRPAPGNHEYETPGARGYYRYFGAAAGRPRMGYYSFELGTWHVVALNSNCADVGGCGRGSPQERWLRADLASHRVRCTLAYWHHPRFSSGAHGSDATYGAFWKALYDANAELVLAGHDHDYERFAPQTSRGVRDVGRVLREIVVGTGGKDLRSLVTIRPNSEVRDATSLGVLELTLGRQAYSWRYHAAVGSFTDSGSTPCH